MFYLYHHYDLGRLAELVATLLERRKRTHPLVSDTIIVPNRGVGRWLQIALAEHWSVAANIEMPLLARFIWQLVPNCLPNAPEARAFERARLRWHLYAVLPQVAAHNSAVAGYLEGTPRAVHRLQLADRLADVFDQYLIYRPQLLADWEAGKIRDKTPDRWQAAVWQALIKRLGNQHRAALLHRFIAVSQSETNGIEDTELPDSIICFGLGHLPPDYLKFLYALGQHVDVHFLLPNPCDGYWGDIQKQRVPLEAPVDDTPAAGELTIEADHPLLASLGRGTRDLLRVLYSEELVNIQEPELDEVLPYEAPTGDHLLAQVQADIIAMQAPQRTTGMADDDVSIQVHACHGPLREVQVLQDQLLALLSTDSDLTPRDIVVMMPTIDDYAPAINSVFGAARGRHYLPWSLSDGARSQSHPIMASFRRLLDLPQSRWTASEILELATVPAIMRRFHLDESALATAADWVQQAGVRWGYDANTRRRFNAGEFAQNSWQFGLDRLLLGVAQSDEDSLAAGVAPWSDLEGGATAALGALWSFVDRLRAWQLALEEPADATAWQDRLNAMVDDLFAADFDDRAEQAAINEISAAIAVLADAAAALDDEALDWQAVREVLAGEMAQAGERQPFLSGGITFCSLMPLRAVPFKVVCLLGLNDSDFPRVEQNRAFNILRAEPRLGDQSVRDDDRLLFLQALTAARSVFYISYTGHDSAGGDELAPSPIVGEWLDFLHRHYFHGYKPEAFRQRLITQQPMHPFSARYFQVTPSQPRLFTFAGEWQPASRAGHQPRIAAPPFDDGQRLDPPEEDIIELAQLRRFFDNPAQHFLRNRLAVDLESTEDEIDDMEPLALGGLDAWQLRANLFDAARDADNTDVATEPNAVWRARGVLPPPPLDHAPFEAQAEQVNRLLPIWRAWCRNGDSATHIDIDLTLEEHRLTGRIHNVWPDGLRIIRPGKLRLQYQLRAWIDYLAYRAAGHDGDLHLAGLSGDGEAEEYVAQMSVEDAHKQLAELLALYQEGQQRPLTFMPELAAVFLDKLDKPDGNADTARDAVNSKLTNDFQPAYAARDPYFGRLLQGGELPDDNEDDLGFDTLAETIGGPLRKALEQADAEK